MNKYDWGIFNGVGGNYDFQDKETNNRIKITTMLNKTLRMFDYENLPESIPVIEMEKLIQTNGYAGIIKVGDEFHAVVGGLGGVRGVYGEPTELVVSNPALEVNKTYEIGKDCVIIKNDYMGMGLIPIFSQYASMLTENEITLILSNVNKRTDNLISVSDDITSESARLYLKKLYEGELGFIFENKLFESLKSKPTSNGNSVNMMDLVQYNQYLKASLLNEVGLQSNHNMKKERLITDEVNADSDSIYALVDSMLESRYLGVERLNEVFGLDVSVMFGGSWVNRNNKTNPDEDFEPIETIEPDEDNEVIEEIETNDVLEDIEVDEVDEELETDEEVEKEEREDV